MEKVKYTTMARAAEIELPAQARMGQATFKPSEIPAEFHSVPLSAFMFDARVLGGPYLEKPKHCFGVKMAKEIKANCDVDIPVVDFQVPHLIDLWTGIHYTMRAMVLDDEIVYVGCMGGKGRTGVFMACLAKVFGEADPIGHVRHHYNPHAVETGPQKTFVNNFPHHAMQRKLKRLLWQRAWRRFLGR